MINRDDQYEHLTQSEDRAVVESLDALGELDGNAAADGLDQRILDSVGAVFVPGAIPMPEQPRAWWARGPIRAAAGLLIVIGVGSMMLLPTRTATPEPEVSVALVAEQLTEMLESRPTDFSDEIASLDLWADTIDTELGTDWVETGLDAGLVGIGIPGGAL